MPRQKLLWKLAFSVLLVAAASFDTARADDLIQGRLTPVSGPSPFADCTADLAGVPPEDVQLNAETEPYLAVNPSNPSHLVGIWHQDVLPGPGARGMIVGVSFTGGARWSNVVLPGYTLCSGGEFERTSDPWVTFSPNGDLYASGLGYGLPVFSLSAPSAVLVSKSVDGGLTWGLPTALIRDTADFFHDKEMIVADPFDSNFVYAVWDRFGSNKGRQTMFSRTTDAGRTWEPARVIYELEGNDQSIAETMVVLPDGTLVNFFLEIIFNGVPAGVSPWTHRVSLIRSSDRGETWLPKQKPIAVADLLAVCPLAPFALVSCLTDPDTGERVRSASGFPFPAVDPNSGRLYVVWEDARFSGFQHHDIAFSMSTDGGFTWSAPIRVNRTPPSDNFLNQQAFRPTVEVAADGTIAVTYYDFRLNDPNPGALTDYWIVHCHPSSPGGCADPASWSSENRITTASFDILKAPVVPNGLFLGDYMGLKSSGNNFLALFAQPHEGDSASIFFRRVGGP
jgi:hypothetical protein